MGKLATSALWASVMGCLLLGAVTTKAETAPPQTAPPQTAPPQTAPPQAAPSETAPTLYTLGQLIARTLGDFHLSADELEWVMIGIEDGVFGHPPRADLAAEAAKLHALQASRRTGQPVVALEGGILLQLLQAGHGQQPKDTDHVQVLYEGMLPDGTVFESALDGARPAVFPVKGVIPCWTRALQSMRVGEKARITCPPNLAYGDRGVPPRIQPNAMLVFNIELINIL